MECVPRNHSLSEEKGAKACQRSEAGTQHQLAAGKRKDAVYVEAMAKLE